MQVRGVCAFSTEWYSLSGMPTPVIARAVARNPNGAALAEGNGSRLATNPYAGLLHFVRNDAKAHPDRDASLGRMACPVCRPASRQGCILNRMLERGVCAFSTERYSLSGMPTSHCEGGSPKPERHSPHRRQPIHWKPKLRIASLRSQWRENRVFWGSHKFTTNIFLLTKITLSLQLI
jgi:hypothetical protein